MDIDIDFPDKFDPTHVMKNAIPASMLKGGDLVKHNCGHYFQSIPVDPVVGVSAIPYEEAEVMGYFKIDFLHLHLLNYFKSKQEIRTLMKQEPDWNLLLDPDVVVNLFQIKNNYDLLREVKPKSVQALADCIALIRPKKRKYLESYIRNPDNTRQYIYRSRAEGDDKSSFKKSHAIAYALTIVLQLHLISQKRLTYA